MRESEQCWNYIVMFTLETESCVKGDTQTQIMTNSYNNGNDEKKFA